MNKKLAYIDYKAGTLVVTMLVRELRNRGINVDFDKTLEQFLQERDLSNYSILLYHPGIKHQKSIEIIRSEYPDITLALITSTGSTGEYLIPDTPIFDYKSVDEIVKFIMDHK